VISAQAQVPVIPEDVEKVNRLLDSHTREGRLRCTIQPFKPLLDFAFRFDTGYVFRCPLKEFEGKESMLWSFMRITPESGSPVLLGAGYRLPGNPTETRHPANLEKLKREIGASGAFTIGEGRYRVEIVLVDDRGRVIQRSWKIQASLRRGEKTVKVAAESSTVAPLVDRLWDGKLDTSGSGVRVTVLLNVAPFSLRVPKLRAWDRALLLGSLSSLLRETPCESVRLVAFNLDQGRVIFEQVPFDSSGFKRLSQGLQNQELETVNYQALQTRTWMELLADLANREVTAVEPSQVAIFLGPRVHSTRKIPKQMLKARETREPQFFYFQFFPYWVRGSDFVDSVGHLTKAEGGTVLAIHEPSELARAIKKMLSELKRSGEGNPNR
jgi:hypothetical protein